MQTNYQAERSAAYPGTLADSRPHVIWKAINGGVDVIPPGCLVTFPAASPAITEPTVVPGLGDYGAGDCANPDKRGAWGIAVVDGVGVEIAPGGVVNVLTRGCVNVPIAMLEPVNPGDGAAVIATFNADAGTWGVQFYRADLAADYDAEVLAGAVFRSHGEPGGTAILELL